MEGLSKIAAATTVAQTLSYSTERKFLETPSAGNDSFCRPVLHGNVNNSLSGFKWLRIDQVGNFSHDSRQNCFDAMQAILHACQMPDTRMAFLVVCHEGVYQMFLGLKGGGKLNGLRNFIMANWKGVSATIRDEKDETLRKFVSKTEFNKCYALTGVPTVNAQNRYSRGIDQIVGGLRDHDDAAYLVLADPVSASRIDGILNTCREIQSQTESFKSFSLSENSQKNKGRTLSRQISHSIAQNIREQAISEKGKKATKFLLGATGLAVAAALIYPPALAMLPTVGAKAIEAGKSLLASSPRLSSALSALNKGFNIQKFLVANGLLPNPRTPAPSIDVNDTTTTTDSYNYTESYSQTISQTITNSHIEAVLAHLKKHADRLSEGSAMGMWEVGCYLLTSVDDKASCAMQVKSVLSGLESIYEPIRVHDISSLMENRQNGNIQGFVHQPNITANYVENSEEGYDNSAFRHPFGEEYARLTTLLTTRELSCFVNFPMNSMPGISVVDCWPDFSLTPQTFLKDEDTVKLGHLLFNRKESEVEVGMRLDALCRHTLVAGVNGSGKTNSVLCLLEGLLQKDRPMMVIEPAKTEYVDWAVKYNKAIDEYNKNAPEELRKKQIRIFIPGCSHYAKGDFKPEQLKMNPFEVIRVNEEYDYKVLSHIDKLKSSLASAFPMQEILPTVIERLLYKLYTDSGWIGKEETGEYPTSFPTLDDVNLPTVKDLMVDLGYAEENTMNISAAIRTRFNSMKYGWKNTLLNNERLQDMTWEDFFSSPCIVNLSYVGDDADKAFIMSMLMQFLYEYRVAESEQEGYSFNDNVCRHLVVVEEAHRVMTRCDNPELPQYRSNQMFASILSEVRAYGQGVMVVDQVPSRLIEDAVKNTNIKVIHKIVAADDAKKVAESMGLSTDQQGVIPRLPTGQAILGGMNVTEILSDHSADIFLAKIEKKK